MHVQSLELLAPIGRCLLGGLFVVAGIRHFFLVPIVSGALAQRGVPMPKLVFIFGTVFQIGAGMLLVLGILVPVAALGLVIFTISASFMLLNFWNLEGAARGAAFNNLLSNIGVVGGLLIVAARSA